MMNNEQIARGPVLSVIAELDKRDAEIERLRADVVHWREARRMCLAAGDMMKAEIERLREEVKLLNSFRPDAELARLRGELLTEIERLRGAIRTHKDNVWGVTTIEHEEDKKLYEAIGE